MTGPVMMNQGWRDLTFLHWAVPPEEVAHLMPPGVRPDTLDGVTYVGLIPFRMVRAGIARGPGVPWFGTFLETNVRLYSVDDTGRRGIVFLSLDADRAAVVLGARAAFGLPYRWARMRHRVERGPGGDGHMYEPRARRPGGRGALFSPALPSRGQRPRGPRRGAGRCEATAPPPRRLRERPLGAA